MGKISNTINNVMLLTHLIKIAGGVKFNNGVKIACEGAGDSFEVFHETWDSATAGDYASTATIPNTDEATWITGSGASPNVVTIASNYADLKPSTAFVYLNNLAGFGPTSATNYQVRLKVNMTGDDFYITIDDGSSTNQCLKGHYYPGSGYCYINGTLHNPGQFTEGSWFYIDIEINHASGTVMIWHDDTLMENGTAWEAGDTASQTRIKFYGDGTSFKVDDVIVGHGVFTH